MPIFVYNSLKKAKEEFSPLNPGRVNIYTCGVTVYDDSHIGHARSLYIFEVIRRYLKHRGFKVRFVRNITDIDDKIVNRAKELKINWRKLVNKYIARYRQDLKDLRISKADYEPRATENIPDMIRYIEGLLKKGYAYVTPSGVYFNVRKFKGYGKLSGQGIDQMLSGVRIEPDENKKDPLDFALWKISRADEPFWNSPWGKGRPGWHIECSVMSQKFLKTETLDIHAGGRDLIFPHHENEIAQAEALTGEPFAKYWIHHGLLVINGQKMAKSLGNFITIKDFLSKYLDADLLKLFFLSAHYSHPMDYNEEKIQEAKKQKRSFDNFFDKVNNWRLLAKISRQASFSEDKDKIDAICSKLIESMDDDFNTPKALACLFELIDLGSQFISSDKKDAFNYTKSKLEGFFDIFGLTKKRKEKLSGEIIAMAKKRDLAKKDKDFSEADRLRKKIHDCGYLVSDTNSSVTLVKIRE